jgi:hypothetical protein
LGGETIGQLSRDVPDDDAPIGGSDTPIAEEWDGAITAASSAAPAFAPGTTKAAKALAKAERGVLVAAAAESEAAEAAEDEVMAGEVPEVNTVTRKKEYRKFYLECRNRKKFPASPSSEHVREPMNLFKLWLAKKGP